MGLGSLPDASGSQYFNFVPLTLYLVPLSLFSYTKKRTEKQTKQQSYGTGRQYFLQN